MNICVIRRRNGNGNAVAVGVETVSPGREMDRCVLAGDLDQAVGLINCERSLFSHTAKTLNRSVDRRSLRLIQSPVK